MEMNQTIFGDCRSSMRDMIEQGVKVQCCVTSPPYFGLRDYGVDGQIGLEKTPDEYVANLVEVFRLVRELLADDGVLWLNLGDSYAGGGGGNYSSGTRNCSGQNVTNVRNRQIWLDSTGLKPKDLIGIPWRAAFALQEDGWYLRQDIVWHKPNPLPESVTDRCTKAHEYIFMLTKNARYYFDNEAIKEPASVGYNGSDFRTGKTAEHQLNRAGKKDRIEDESRNRRSVWTVPTQPYSGAHFAVFPPALIEPCILAGSKTGDIVLDPFMGSGTTGQVAQALGRQWIGCELNPEYAPLQQARTAQLALAL